MSIGTTPERGCADLPARSIVFLVEGCHGSHSDDFSNWNVGVFASRTGAISFIERSLDEWDRKHAQYTRACERADRLDREPPVEPKLRVDKNASLYDRPRYGVFAMRIQP